MELTYNELRKRDVINVADGRCLGKICDLKLLFPQGRFLGITVPGRKCGFWGFFHKIPVYLHEKNIIKIGGDVILVNLSCGEVCSDSVNVNGNKRPNKPSNCPPNPCSFNPCGFEDRGEGKDSFEDY
jgi:YlmC/YmxH family sporulation protein